MPAGVEFAGIKRQSACKPGSGWPEDRSPDVTAIPLGRALLRASSNQPGRQGTETCPCPLARAASSLFGFAPGGACHAVPVAGSAVRSYRTFSPLPHAEARGGSISVALSLGSPPPDVIRHRVSVEPGLSSLASESGRPADWRGGDARWRGRRQARKITWEPSSHAEEQPEAASLERRPEKWSAVFGKSRCKIKRLEYRIEYDIQSDTLRMQQQLPELPETSFETPFPSGWLLGTRARRMKSEPCCAPAVSCGR